jgi:hypothetical protein
VSNGKGCKCNAHCEHECCCDADWTPKEVYDLRADLAQRTAEVAKANAERDRKAETVASLLNRIALTREAAGFCGMLEDLPTFVRSLRDERDEARREACVSEARYREERAYPLDIPREEWIQRDARSIAAERGWDCFAPHATDVRVQNGGE